MLPTEKQKDQLQRIRDAANKIISLTDNPELGIFSWWEALNYQMKRIEELRNEKV
jgi:hypothetical protein